MSSSLTVSDYEKVRLANIARNEAFLKNIGLAETKARVLEEVTSLEVISSKDQSKSKRKQKSEHDEGPVSRRRSSRLTGAKLDGHVHDDPEGE